MKRASDADVRLLSEPMESQIRLGRDATFTFANKTSRAEQVRWCGFSRRAGGAVLSLGAGSSSRR
eukprot:IDg11981t1